MKGYIYILYQYKYVVNMKVTDEYMGYVFDVEYSEISPLILHLSLCYLPFMKPKCKKRF